MPSYKFSRREKVLLIVLGAVVVVVAWFMLVFQNATSEIARLDGEIADTQTQISTKASMISQKAKMEQQIEEFEAQGAHKVEVPTYDNLRPLMAELNTVLATTDTYSLTFEDVEDSNGAYISRGVRIDFGCGSYDSVKTVVDSLANGKYPCMVDSLSIVDNESRRALRTAMGAGASGTGNSAFTASAHMIFFEKAA